jgi:aldehyde:ferredoxin oxidoreductase
VYGWIGTIIRVNLTTGTIIKEPLNEQYAFEYVGQRGLAVKYYFDECDPKTGPFDPGNKVMIMTGPLTGLLGTCTGQYEVVAKSPLTGKIGAANSSGHFGPELKFAGYDGIILEGQSDQPVYLYIFDDTVELRSADAIWGKSISEATDYLRKQCSPKARVCCIGPAAENRSRFGCVVSDKHFVAGRDGLGAVMGSKKLKGITVHGAKAIKVAHPQEYLECVFNSRKELLAHPVTFSLGVRAIDLMNDPHYSETKHEYFLKKRKACFSCPIGCRYVIEIKDGPCAGIGECIGSEASLAFGTGCRIKELDAVIYANWLCLEYGMEPVSCGAAIACAMQLATSGALSEAEIGLPRPLRFGDTVAMVALTRMIGRGVGFGKRLAKGAGSLAAECGHPELSDIADSFLNKQTADEKERTLMESSGICLFCDTAIPTPRLTEQLTLATGHTFTAEDGAGIGERICNLERLFNNDV